MTEEQLDRFIE